MGTEKYAAQNKYAAKYKKQIKIDCFTSTEQDIIDKLESVPNKAGYIKQLIREDMRKEQEAQKLHCDRDICFKNDANGIGCEECEVTKSNNDRQ